MAPSILEHLAGHQSSHLPLGFDCVLEDGTTYPSSNSYAWMNALIVVFGVGAVA